MPAANVRRRHPRFLFLQDRDDLLFAEPAALHSVRLLRVGLYSKSVTFQGSTSRGLGRQRLSLQAQREVAVGSHAHLSHPSAQTEGQAHDEGNRTGQRSKVLDPRPCRTCLRASEEPLRAVHPDHRPGQSRSEAHPLQPGLQLQPADLPRTPGKQGMTLPAIRRNQVILPEIPPEGGRQRTHHGRATSRQTDRFKLHGFCGYPASMLGK